jgi:membrane protein implicated in regulation of membrane protease activity
MYLIAIGWLYVALMMAAAEAAHARGTLLGAILTFFLYGVAPVSLVIYLIGRPGRKRTRQQREAAATAAAQAASQAGAVVPPPAASGAPDGRGESPAHAVPPVRKEP